MTERPSFIRHGLFIYRPLTSENAKSFAHCFKNMKYSVEENAAKTGDPVPYFKNMDSDLAGKILETLGKRGLIVYGNLSHYEFLLHNGLTGETEESDFSKLIAKSRMIAQSLLYDNISIDTDMKQFIEAIDSLRTDKILVPFDVHYKFKIPEKIYIENPEPAVPPRQQLRAREQLLTKLRKALYHISKERKEVIRQKIYTENSETFGEFTIRYNMVCENNADYSKLNFSKLDSMLENKMGKALQKLFNLDHKVAFQELKSSIPELFGLAKQIAVNKETIEKFSKTAEEYAREAINKHQNMVRVWDWKLHKYVDSEASQEMLESSFEKDKKAFNKVLCNNPLLKKYVEEQWEKLKRINREIPRSRGSDIERAR